MGSRVGQPIRRQASPFANQPDSRAGQNTLLILAIVDVDLGVDKQGLEGTLARTPVTINNSSVHEQSLVLITPSHDFGLGQWHFAVFVGFSAEVAVCVAVIHRAGLYQ